MRNSPQHFLSSLGERARLRWQHCTVIEGDARLILMTQENLTSDDFRMAAMPNLREITGSLLVFQVVGMDSLNVMFPNLRIIRGNSLVSNYALVLFQNPDLKEIGLSNLTEISKGGVRIAGNSELCYVDTINWNELCREDSAHILIEENKDTVLCSDVCEASAQEDLCIVHGSTSSTAPTARRACWNRDKCQLGCPKQCKEFGLSCNTSATPPFCCHPQCAAGCTGLKNTDCSACRNVRYNKVCLEKCPENLYKVIDRRCITREECVNRNPIKDETNGDYLYYKAVKTTGECVVKCPPGYEEDATDKTKCSRCNGVCPQ
ncbi:unnamed protein product, partial [Soboliphyme baturini]|uniref:receptor protein-tyrosine kinase n=1 Tax=Soboliphyme baturini TaxID=241478 RepID=A0A183IYL3_9BILA